MTVCSRPEDGLMPTGRKTSTETQNFILMSSSSLSPPRYVHLYTVGLQCICIAAKVPPSELLIYHYSRISHCEPVGCGIQGTIWAGASGQQCHLLRRELIPGLVECHSRVALKKPCLGTRGAEFVYS